MKRKHLALLTLLLSQSTSLWGMDLSDLPNDIEKVRIGVQKISSKYNPQESVIILGPTGSGKSTLINLLAGRNFKAEQGTSGFSTKKPVCLNPLPDSNMSGNNIVGTTIPFGWGDNNGLTFWDCPGFGDPRGPKEDIINAFSIHELFKGKLKFLLLSEESFIGDTRSTKFLELLKEATDILPNDKELAQSLSIVVTKQEKLDDPYKFIKSDILSLTETQQPLLTPRVRKFLEHLVDPNTPKRISLIPSPTVLGTYTPDLNPLRMSIEETVASNNPETQLVVSDKAKLLIKDYAQILNTQISDLIKNEGSQSVVKYCNTKITDHVDLVENLRNTLKNTENYLNDFKNGLLGLSSTQVNQFMTYLNSLFTTQLTDLLPTTSLRKMIEAFSFLKNIEKNINYNVNGWAHSCSTLIDKVHPLTQTPEIQVNQNILNLKGVFIGTSDIVQALQIHQQTNIKRVNVFGLSKLFVDEDLNTPGTSLNLIAPDWKILGNKTINLSGLTGLDGPNGSISGEDGQPGGPGSNGGDFYGKGNNFYGLDLLTVNTNGGSGGNGGNGHRGLDGANGRDGNLLVKTISGNTHYYNDQGTDGQPGGNGGRGGHGGLGGHSGYSVIDGYNNWAPIPFDGTPGTNGIAGAGGQGGKHGKHCQGTYVTGRTTQEAYTDYRYEPRTKQESYQAIQLITGRTEQQPYEVSDLESTPVGWSIFSGIISLGIAPVLMSQVKRTHYRTVPLPDLQVPYTAYRSVNYEERVGFTAYRTVSLPDLWTVPQGHQGDRGFALNGSQGNGLNPNTPQNPPTQSLLNRDVLLPYNLYYQESENDLLTSKFVRDFPNL